MELGQVAEVAHDHGQQGPLAGGVGDHLPESSPDHGLPEGAVVGRVGHPLAQAQIDRGQCGHALRFDPVGLGARDVVRDDQSSGAGDDAAVDVLDLAA